MKLLQDLNVLPFEFTYKNDKYVKHKYEYSNSDKCIVYSMYENITNCVKIIIREPSSYYFWMAVSWTRDEFWAKVYDGEVTIDLKDTY